MPTPDPRYPIGPFSYTDPVDPTSAPRWIERIAATPAELRAAVDGLDDAQLDTPYRDGGWTVRQVVHHLTDSHVQAYARVRLALTEDTPMILGYNEQHWAELADARSAPVELSLRTLESLHARWTALLETLGPAELARTWRHAEVGEVDLTVAHLLACYAWHGPHHVAHIRALRERRGW